MSDTNPTPTPDLEQIAHDAAEELVRQVRGIVGELPDEMKAKAREIADAAVALASDYARGRIDREQFKVGREALTLAARSALVTGLLSAWGKRTAMIQAAIPVLVQALVTAAGGGRIV